MIGITHVARFVCAATATAVLGAGLAALTAPVAHASPTEAPTTAKAGKDYHAVAANGPGKKKAKLAACTTGTDSLLVFYKASIKKTSDTTAPRFYLTLGDSGLAEFSLFPGGQTKKYKQGYYSPDEVLTVKIRNLGKTKTKSVAIGELGAC